MRNILYTCDVCAKQWTQSTDGYDDPVIWGCGSTSNRAEPRIGVVSSNQWITDACADCVKALNLAVYEAIASRKPAKKVGAKA